jgi:hypothetical protein
MFVDGLEAFLNTKKGFAVLQTLNYLHCETYCHCPLYGL